MIIRIVTYLIGFDTSVVTITTSCREVLTRRNEHPKTRHPSEYVSFVASVTNASRFSEEKQKDCAVNDFGSIV